MEKRGVIEPGITPAEDKEKQASADLEDHPAKRLADEFTRSGKMREDGFTRRILPPIRVGNDELDRSVPTDKPIKVVDKLPPKDAES